MKLGRWGWRLKRLSLARFQQNRAMGFGESAKNGSQRRCFWWCELRTTSVGPTAFLRSISAKLSTNTCPGGGSRHMVSHSRKVSIKGSNLPKNPLFRVPYLWPGKRSATPTLFPSSGGHPTDVPYLTFAEGCTVFQLSMSERLPLPRYQQWRNLNLDAYISFKHTRQGAHWSGRRLALAHYSSAHFLVSN